MRYVSICSPIVLGLSLRQTYHLYIVCFNPIVYLCCMQFVWPKTFTGILDVFAFLHASGSHTNAYERILLKYTSFVRTWTEQWQQWMMLIWQCNISMNAIVISFLMFQRNEFSRKEIIVGIALFQFTGESRGHVMKEQCIAHHNHMSDCITYMFV